jgi:hypothetical protein
MIKIQKHRHFERVDTWKDAGHHFAIQSGRDVYPEQQFVAKYLSYIETRPYSPDCCFGYTSLLRSTLLLCTTAASIDENSTRTTIWRVERDTNLREVLLFRSLFGRNVIWTYLNQKHPNDTEYIWRKRSLPFHSRGIFLWEYYVPLGCFWFFDHAKCWYCTVLIRTHMREIFSRINS